MTYSREIWKITKCHECGGDNLVEDYVRGEIICHNCGLVTIENVMDRGPEWRAFTKEQKVSRGRTGMPMHYYMHDKGLSTVIDRVSRDAHGKQLSISKRLEMLKLRKWQYRILVHSSVEKNLANAMAELDRLADILYIPTQVKERAAVIYRKTLDNGIVRGRSILGLIAAALYAACRATETPRTLKEVAFASGMKKKVVARCYRFLLKELDIKMPVEDPIRCISKIASKVNIPVRAQRIALRILREAKLRGEVSGKDPMGLAAAALYIACVLIHVKKSQKEIAEVAEVTEVTIRNRAKGLKESLNLKI